MQITPQLYQDMSSFAATMLQKHTDVYHIDKLDVVHDVLCYATLVPQKWQSLIVSCIYKYKHRQLVYSLDAIPQHKPITVHLQCKYCQQVLPEHQFISGYNATTQQWQYRTICKHCYKKTDKYKQAAKKTHEAYYAANREKLLQKAREYRKTHIDYTAKERQRRYRETRRRQKLSLTTA